MGFLNIFSDKIKNASLLHPLLLAIWPCIFLYAHNIEQMNWQDILAASCAILICTVLLIVFTRLFTANLKKCALVCSGILIWFFVYGHLYLFLRGSQIGGFIIGRNLFLIPLWTLACSLFILYILQADTEKVSTVNSSVNVISVLLIALCFFSIGEYHIRQSFQKKPISVTFTSKQKRQTVNSEKMSEEATINNFSVNRKYPNIFYIILDSYPANNQLKAYFEYDNKDFTEYLEEKGFYIAHNSHSNYAFTGLSLSSSLNMEYINYLSEQEGKSSKDKSVLSEMIQSNKLTKLLSDFGYQTERMGSWYSLTSYNSNNTSLLNKLFFTEFTITLLKTTILHSFSEQFMAPMLREGVTETFNAIKRLANTQKPTFVFAHIICPHPPFIFGENGEKITWLQSVNQKLDPGTYYINQLKYINKLTINMLNTLVETSAVKPIIIIQGDHGAAYVTRDIMASPIEPPADFIKAQMSILNAYYVPEDIKKTLYPSITPVNSFRKILNISFGTNFNKLPDSSYYSRHISPYDFSNVTNTLR